MFNPASYERRLTTDAIIQHLDAGHTLDIVDGSDGVLGELLGNPYALNQLGDEGASAVGLIWRLGLAHDMSRQVLASVACHSERDSGVLQDPGFRQGKAIARELLRGNPRLLENIGNRNERAFWRLVGYDGTAQDEGSLLGILGTLEVLQDATYLPEEVIRQMRRYRDNSSAMCHDPQLRGIVATAGSVEFDIVDPDKRHQQITEASVSVILGSFVARYTREDDDHRVAAIAVDNFANCALNDALGFACALSLMTILKSVGVTEHNRTQDIVRVLRERITDFAPQIELVDTPLADLVHLAEEAHTFVQQGSSQAMDELLTRIESRLVEYESFYGIVGDPHLTDTVAEDARAMRQVSQAFLANEGLSRVLGKLRSETTAVSVYTPETVIDELTTRGFSTKLVHAAFKLVGAELDEDRKTQLTAIFDVAINTAIKNLKPNDPLSGSNGLSELNGNADLGVLARFPSGRRFIAGRTGACAQLVSYHLQHPDSWFNQQRSPDMVAASWLYSLHDALLYNREYFREVGEAGLDMIVTVKAALGGIKSFIDQTTAQEGMIRTLTVGYENLVALLDEAQVACCNHQIPERHATTSIGSPLSQLLKHYLQLARQQ